MVVNGIDAITSIHAAQRGFCPIDDALASFIHGGA
jgi:hypothetical protein